MTISLLQCILWSTVLYNNIANLPNTAALCSTMLIIRWSCDVSSILQCQIRVEIRHLSRLVSMNQERYKTNNYTVLWQAVSSSSQNYVMWKCICYNASIIRKLARNDHEFTINSNWYCYNASIIRKLARIDHEFTINSNWYCIFCLYDCGFQ